MYFDLDRAIPNNDPSPLHGNWSHDNGIISCGTIRIAIVAFDTCPNFQEEVLDWMCDTLNKEQQ